MTCLSSLFDKQQVAKDKERYAREMKDYTPPEGSGSPAKGKAKKAKAKKDPNAPKGKLSAYMYYVQEMRSQLQKENPEMSFGDLGKELGKRWKVISEEEKAKFQAMAKKDAKRHELETAAYESKKKGDKAKAEKVNDDDDDDDDSDGMNDSDDDDDSDDE